MDGTTRFIPKYLPNMYWTGKDWDEWKAVIQDRYNYRLVILRSGSCIEDNMVTMLDDIARDNILAIMTPIVHPEKTVFERYVNYGKDIFLGGVAVYHIPSNKILAYYTHLYPLSNDLYIDCMVKHPIYEFGV